MCASSFVKVSYSSELNSFLLIVCIDAPESSTNCRSSSLFEVGAGITFDFTRNIKRSFGRILELVNVVRQIPRCFAGASFLVHKVSSLIFLRIVARKDYAHEVHTLG